MTRDFDRRMDRACQRLKIGMPRAEAIGRMGQPARESPQFELGQYKGNEEAYARAARSGAETYLVWFNGGDYTYCIGIGEDGTVVAKEEGGT